MVQRRQSRGSPGPKWLTSPSLLTACRPRLCCCPGAPSRPCGAQSSFRTSQARTAVLPPLRAFLRVSLGTPSLPEPHLLRGSCSEGCNPKTDPLLPLKETYQNTGLVGAQPPSPQQRLASSRWTSVCAWIVGARALVWTQTPVVAGLFFHLRNWVHVHCWGKRRCPGVSGQGTH